jgi:ATP-dependent Lon protease
MYRQWSRARKLKAGLSLSIDARIIRRVMHDMDDEQRKSVLGEALMDELRAIRERLDDLPAIKANLDSVDARLETVETDVKAIKAAVRDISGVLRQHDEDIALLKPRAA